MARVYVRQNDEGVYVTAHRVPVYDITGEYVSTIIGNLQDATKTFYGDPCLVDEGGYGEPDFWLTGVRLATPAEITDNEERLRKAALSAEKRKAEQAAQKAAQKARGDLQALRRAQEAFPELFDKPDES